MRSAAARELLRRRVARKDLLAYLHYIWWKPLPLVEGRHVRALCRFLTEAVDRYIAGESTNALVLMPFRHLKSTICSVALPSFFMGRLREQQPDVLMTGYGADLVEGFSIQVKQNIESPPHQRLFPGMKVDHDLRDRMDYWRIAGWNSEVHVAGLGGSITGHGANLAILDDYFKKRAEANSPTMRQNRWDEFTNEFKTRWGNPHIALVVATPWDEDDIQGRIRTAMKEDSRFPRFEVIRFPATNEDGTYLWPEWYRDDWYEENYATLRHDASGLMDCDPRPRKGTVFDTDLFQYHPPEEMPRNVRRVRPWDLASTEKQVGKNDPDFTCGPLMAVTYDDAGAPHIWIYDVEMGQWGTTERDRRIARAHERDPENVEWGIEGVAGYKDTFNRFRDEYRGKRIVRLIDVPGDKFERITYLEPIVEAGHFHLAESLRNSPFVEQFRRFPTGHDDGPDATAGGYFRLRSCAPGRAPVIWSVGAPRPLAKEGVA